MATADRSDPPPTADATRREPLIGVGYSHVASRHGFTRLTASAEPLDEVADIADEVPVGLVYNGRQHVVVMASPADLEDLAIGFSLTESIIDDAADVERASVVKASHGIEVQVEIPAPAADRLERRARGLVARTGCGLCGVETIAEAMRVPRCVGDRLRIDPGALWRAAAELAERQALNNRTNSVHAAAWADRSGEIALVREDVGRHNALDKVIGALVREGRTPQVGFIVVTSRASYEMVQKTATIGVELLAAISRPTGLAIRFADAAGLTLVGLLRGRSGNVYSRLDRITVSPSRKNE